MEILFLTITWTKLLCTILIIGLIYQFGWKYWTYFSSRNIPFIRGIPILGSNYKLFIGQGNINDCYANLYNRFPNEPLIGIYDFGGVPVYLVREPELIKQITIKNFNNFLNRRVTIDEQSDPLMARNLFFINDQHWKDMRSTLSPSFTGSKMRQMFDLLIECCEQFIDFIKIEQQDDCASDVENVDEKKNHIYEMKEIFTRFANDTIATCAFGLKVNSMKEKNNEFYKIGQSMTENLTKNVMKLLGFAACPKLMNLLKIRLINKNVEEYFRSVIHNTINYRQTNNIQRLDMVDLLMKTNQDFTETDIVAQCMIFFVAGFDTVSTLLSFMAHELALNQNIQEKLYQEILNTAEKLNNNNNERLSYEIINKIKYLDMCISETLRKWTTAGLIDRVTSQTCQLEYDNGKILNMNIGDSFIIPSFAIHRDPKFYPNPDVFDPERFNDENIKNILPGTYMPFGIGPRICIGSRFALMETKAIFYYLLLNFQIEKCNKTQDPLKLGLAGTPDNGFWLQLKKRSI